jgi:membrane peptidoglycan carboxypeptidase
VLPTFKASTQHGYKTVLNVHVLPAWKTGTTNECRDAIFVGSTFGPDGITAAVRIGFDDNRSLGSRETGGRLALPLFQELMLGVYRDKIVGAAPAFPVGMEARITASLLPPSPPPTTDVAGGAVADVFGATHRPALPGETYWPISYWKAYVAVTQMGGQGNFSDPRLGIDIKHSPDMVTSKLPALRAYQHSLPAPPPPAGSFDAAIAERGRTVFDRTCASCHVGGSGTDNNGGTLHPPADTGVDGAYATRTANKAYRTTPLRALWQHPPYFHDGSAATLSDVVAHYNRVRKLDLTAEQQRELIEYLKSL